MADDPIIVTTNGAGQPYSTNAQLAPNFNGFLNDLAATGYPIKSVQGYNDRNIDGTNIKSHHASGAAIDINPDENPVNGSTNFPPNVSQLAAKWGLGWGGNWTGAKKDPMHFSAASEEGGVYDIPHLQQGQRAVFAGGPRSNAGTPSPVATPAPQVGTTQSQPLAYGTQSRADLENELFSPTPTPSAPAPTTQSNEALKAELFGQPAPVVSDSARQYAMDNGLPLTPGMSTAQMASGVDANGRPFQVASNADPAHVPVAQSMGRSIATDALPGAITQGVVGLATDPEQRRRIAAGQLFPNLSPKDAAARVFYGDGGRLAAVGANGNPFYVDPESLSLSRPSTFLPGNLGANIAGQAGNAIPAISGTVAGIAGGPTSLIAGPALAGAGAAAGDVGRQYLARLADPQPELAKYNPVQTAAEAIGGALGQGVGALGVRMIAPNRLGASALDVNRLRAGTALPEAERVANLGTSQGVQLTSGQASGLPSLLGHEDAIKSGAAGPGLSDMASNFYRNQGNQLTSAGQAMLDRVSPITDKTDAAMIFQQGAEDATRLTRQNANAVARPSYQAAQNAGQVMSPDLAQLADTPAMQTALTQARQQYANIYRTAAPESPDFALWDLAKRHLDDAQAVARRAGENTTAMSLDGVRSDLLTHLDAAYPTYAQARELAAPGQRASARLDSIAGSAVGDGTERARAIVAPVFEGNNPRAITEARNSFAAAGRSDEWNAGVRAYVQDSFDKASQSQAGLNPAMLRRQIWGNTDNRAAIQAAMDPAAYQGFDNFMQTVEAAARTYPMNSLTAPRQAATNALMGAAADTPGVTALNALGVATNPLKLAQVGSIGTDKLAGYLTRRNLQNISENLFSPDGMEYLRAMGSMSPGSQRALTATTEFLGQTGARRVAAANDGGAPNQLLGQKATK